MKKTALLAGLLAAASLTAQAQTHSPAPQQQQAAEGGYFGLGVGQSFGSGSQNAAASIPNSEGEKKATGGKVYLGYLWGNWGLELGLYTFGKSELKTNGAKVGEFKTDSIAVSGVYTTTIANNDSFILNLRGGGASVSSEFTCAGACAGGMAATEKTSTVLTSGIGLGWKISRGVMLRLDYERFEEVEGGNGLTTSKGPYELISGGVQFTF